MATEHWLNRLRWLQRGYIWLDRQGERLRQRRRLRDLRLRGAPTTVGWPAGVISTRSTRQDGA